MLPVMADDSSRRVIQNAFSLIYGSKLPSDIYASYAFATRLKNAGRPLPQVHAIAKNRHSQYMGPSSAYAAALQSIYDDVSKLLMSNSEIFASARLSKAWSTSVTSRPPEWWPSPADAPSTGRLPASWRSWGSASRSTSPSGSLPPMPSTSW